METLFKNAPYIIEQAAKSELGILALMILAVCVIALLFFRRESAAMKTLIFFLLFSGIFVFGYSMKTAQKTISVLREFEILPNEEISSIIDKISKTNCYKSQINQINAMKNAYPQSNELIQLEITVRERATAIKEMVKFGERLGSSDGIWFLWDKCNDKPGGFKMHAPGRRARDSAYDMISTGDQLLVSGNYKQAILEYRNAQALFKSL